MSYIKDHWHGRHSLSRALWVNFLPLFLLLWWLLQPLLNLLGDNFALSYRIALGYCILAFLVVFPWQVLGLIRSCERYLADYGNQLVGKLVQLTVVLGTLAAIVATIGAFQKIGARQSDLEFGRQWEQATARVYDISMVPGTRIARLKGDIQNGTTRKLEQWLQSRPEVEGLILESTGGRVYEGRGVARIIEQRGLDTYSLEGCFSACTTAFIAGNKRYLGEHARLGFHQYKLDSNKSFGYLDSDEEQEKDVVFYRRMGIDEAFLEQVFDKPENDMWFPPLAALLKYRVIHAVLNEASQKALFADQ